MTDVKFRWYQTEAIDAFFSYFDNANGNPLISLPTGSGKSIVQATIAKTILTRWPNQRLMFLTHVKELVRQNFRQMQRVWPTVPAGVYSAGLKQRDLHFPITFGSVISVAKVIDAFGHIDLLFVDEAHLVGGNDDGSYNKIIATLRAKNPYLKVVGLTATKWRTAMGLLTNGPIFTDVCYDICNIPGFQRLFADNHLVPPHAKGMQTQYDVSEVKMAGDDFSQSGLQKVTKNEKVTWKALQESLARGADRNCRLVFCTGVEHAMLSAAMLRALGLKAKAVHSKMPDVQRDEIMGQFFAGELDALTNNGICTTGIDHPPIDHIIMLRPSASVGLWVQMLGRGTRPYECNGWHKSDCLVTDHAGNASRLGTIDDPYIPKQKGKTAGEMPVKICPACGTYNHAVAKFCSDCGEPFIARIGYVEKPYEGPLVRGEIPQYEFFDVTHVYYQHYLKQHATPTDKPTIKATYQCGLNRYTEYIAIEGVGFALKRAKEWWRQRFPQEGFMPTRTNEAMQFVDRLIPPKRIKVWVNKKFPEIMGYEY